MSSHKRCCDGDDCAWISTMYRFRPKQDPPSQQRYATCADFCDSLIHDLRPLYLLAFLLTGSHSEAEQCLIASVGDAISADCVFKGREYSWSKRCLIIDAIRRVFPGPTETLQEAHDKCEVEAESAALCTINAVARLAPPIQRFAFVMSVLERYSEHECAVLLGCAPRDVREARVRALWQLSGSTPTFLRNAG
jgi:hypothetical protein